MIDPIDGTSNYVRDIRVWGTAVAAVVDGERSPRPPSRPRWATCTPPTRTARTATESRCASVTCLIHGGPRWTRRCGGTSTPVTSTPPPARRSFGDSATCAGSAPHRSCCRRSPRADWRGPSRTCGEPVGLRRRRVHGSAGRGESDGYRGEPLATRLNRARRLERESPRRSARRGARDRGTRLRGRLHCEESEATLTQTAACRARAAPRGRRGRGWSRRRTARSRRAGRS